MLTTLKPPKLLPLPRITKRTLDLRHGGEGPAHDPYGWVEYMVTTNLLSVSLRQGELSRTVLRVDGKRMPYSEMQALEEFQRLTGIEPWRFERYYARVCGDFIDPMGRLSDYI